MWRYIVKDTIEERVLALRSIHAEGAAGKAALMRSAKREKIETRSGGGGEVVGHTDVRWCLFGEEDLKDAHEEGEAAETTDGIAGDGREGEAALSYELNSGGNGDVDMEVCDEEPDVGSAVLFSGDDGGPAIDADAMNMLAELRWMVESEDEASSDRHEAREVDVSRINHPRSVNGNEGGIPKVKVGRGRMGRRKGRDEDGPRLLL